MKNIVLIVSVFLSIVSSAVELSQATNGQLIRELESRLQGSGPAAGATASFACDNSRNLIMEIMNSVGNTKKQSIYIGYEDYCESLAADMTQYKSRVDSLRVVAICDNSRNLLKYPLLPTGDFGTATSLYIGDDAKCRKMAKNINTSN